MWRIELFDCEARGSEKNIIVTTSIDMNVLTLIEQCNTIQVVRDELIHQALSGMRQQNTAGVKGKRANIPSNYALLNVEK